MQCDICRRPASSQLPVNCTLCARDTLYQPRVQFAQALLQKEKIGTEVEQITVVSSKPRESTTTRATKQPEPQPSITWTIRCATAEQVILDEEKKSTLRHVQILRDEIQKTRHEISERKSRLQRRQSEFASAKQELSQSRTTRTEPIEKFIRRTEYRRDMMHNKTAESRLYLCREAALLYGLQQRKRKRGGLGRDVYLIGGVPIADIRDLNNASPTQVTTSTTNLAHLIHLISHYLSLRLPAEITLPHRDYPLPTIFSPTSSYSGREVPFPGSTPSNSSNNSPSASRHTDRGPLPKPRPLHLDKRLSALAKDEQVAYASFVEGITFLGWDVAWLCKTQGLNTGDNSWNDICAMGKNLWQLLLAPLARPPLPKELSSKSSPQKPVTFQTPSTATQAPTMEPRKNAPLPGYFSHGTAYGYLAAAEGNEYMRGWRLQSPIRVIEKVKAMLLAERTGAEWEILEGNEWEAEEADTDAKREPDLVNRPLGIEETGILVRPEAKEGSEGERAWKSDRDEGEEKGRSTSGWTKLKSR